MRIEAPPTRTALSLMGWLAFASTAQAAEERHEQGFILLNASSWQITELYVSPAVSTSEFTNNWGANLVGTAAIQSKDGRRVVPTGNGTSCAYDAHIVYQDEANEEFDEIFYIDLCENDTIYVDDFFTDWGLIWSSHSTEEAVEEFEV